MLTVAPHPGVAGLDGELARLLRDPEFGVSRAVEGRVFRSIAEHTWSNLLALARTITRDDHDAEDAVVAGMERFLCAVRDAERRARIVSDKPYAYLRRVVRNTAINSYNRRVSRSRLLERATVLAGVAPPAASQEDAVRIRRTGTLLRHLLQELSVQDRYLVLTTQLEGCSYREVAAAVGLQPATARQRVRRALAKLRGTAQSWERRPPAPLRRGTK